jgi:hypothetical protein
MRARPLAFAAVLAFSLLRAAVSQAGTYTTTVQYTGCGNGNCICGSPDYSCFNGCGGPNVGVGHAFTDQTPAGSIVTGVAVAINGVTNSTQVTTSINGVAVGNSVAPPNDYSCACEAIDFTTAGDANGFPGWVYGGTNNLAINVGDAGQGNNLCAASATITVTYIVVGPRIAAAPSPLDFGSFNVGTVMSKNLTISNSGSADLIVSNYTFSGTNGGDFSSTTPVPFTVPVGGSMPISVSCSPGAVGTRSGSIALASNDPTNPTTSVALTANGVSPTISLAPTGVDFGKVLVGTTSNSTAIVVTNSGSATLTISNVVLGGSGAAQFQFAPGVLPVVIPPTSTSTFNVTFDPSTVGSFSGTLTFTSDDLSDMNAVVPLKGDGISPMIAIDQAALDFGAQLVGHTSTARTVTVSNNGTAPLTLGQVTITGAQSADFAQVGAVSLPVTLQPGDTQPLGFVLTAASIGAEAATVTLASDDPKLPQVTVSLTGTGVSTVMSVSPATIDFGPVKAPGSGTAQMIKITNSSGDPITLVAPTISGATASAFTVDSPAGVLAPGASIQVAANFTAAMAGDYSATATLSASDATVPSATVMLSGKGISSLIVAAPSSLDFGMLLVGMTSAGTTVTLTNQSASSIQLMSVSSGDPSFVVSGVDTTNAIAPGATSVFSVAFAPTTPGSKTGQVAITLVGGSGTELNVMAVGTGTAPSPDLGGTVSSPDLGAGVSDGGVVSSPDLGSSGGSTSPQKSAGCSCSIGAGKRGESPAAMLLVLLFSAGVLMAQRRRRHSTR